MFQRQEMTRAGNCCNIAARYFISGVIKRGTGQSLTTQSISCPERNGWLQQVCRKCAVRFDPMCAKSLLFNTRPDCFRAGLIVGKLLNLNGDKTWKTLSDSPTLNQ